MSVYKKDNKFSSLLIVLISLFILVFFTKNMFYNTQEQIDKKELLSYKLSDKKSELENLELLEKDLESGDKKEEINMFLRSFSEDEILSYMYNYVEEFNSSETKIIIQSMNLSEPVESELGFKEVKLNLNIIAGDIEVLKSFLSFLTDKDSAYRFFITDFSYPNDSRKGAYKVNIPLRLFYK